jgi:hypothetical protein
MKASAVTQNCFECFWLRRKHELENFCELLNKQLGKKHLNKGCMHALRKG